MKKLQKLKFWAEKGKVKGRGEREPESWEEDMSGLLKYLSQPSVSSKIYQTQAGCQFCFVLFILFFFKSKKRMSLMLGVTVV